MKLTIRPRPAWDQDRDALMTGHDLEVLLDGVELTALAELELRVAMGELVTCSLRITPSDIEIDSNVVAALVAMASTNEGDEGSTDDE